MSIWENFEEECTGYLNSQFGKYASFRHRGGSDSSVADIAVTSVGGSSFYVEAKHSPAQCGQFVLIPDTKQQTFRYSEQNLCPLNRYSMLITEYMNSDFAAFANAGTVGKDICFPDCDRVFADWIKEYYRAKGVRFFITNGYTLLPIDRFEEYFDVTAKYRVKRSGSASLGKSRIPTFIRLISEGKLGNGKIGGVRAVGAKLFVSSDDDLHGVRFSDGENEYMFSARGNEYELRKLSATENANVIFSVKHTGRLGISEREFIKALI